jgi:hypothetical protein
MARPTKILKRAFIVTVATAAAATGAIACDNNASEVISNPPICELPEDCSSPQCPSTEPANGSACPALDLACSYGDDICTEVMATCGADGWEVYPASSCNPPPPMCPADEPTVGELCEPDLEAFEPYPSYCPYDVSTPCGEASTVLGCAADVNDEWVWTLQEAPPACDLPPEQCHLQGAEAGCNAESNCEWLHPGCTEDDNPITAGCYPTIDCTNDPTLCGDWGACTSGWMDPCHNSPCGACGAEVSVCIVTAML